jgi:hypothetical protein
MGEEGAPRELLFEVPTPLGWRVRTTPAHWMLITTLKHPVMAGQENVVQEVLRAPQEIRVSQSDPSVHLFYRLELPGRWLCVVAKRLNGEGFLITTYPTDAVKEGRRLWPR